MLSALDTLLKHAYDIIETSEDNREKLQAMQSFKDTELRIAQSDEDMAKELLNKQYLHSDK